MAMPRSIASTLVLILLAITVTLLVVSTAVRIYQGRGQVIDQTKLQAEALRANITHMVRFEGLEAPWLQPFLFSLSSEPGIRRLMVLDNGGIVRAHSDPRRVGQPVAGLRVGRTPDYSLVEGAEGLRLRLVAPIEPVRFQSGRVGAVVVELALERVLQANLLYQSVYLLVLIGVALVAVSLIYVFLHRTVIRPLALIEDGARRIDAGRFHERVAYDSPNELGALARSFNGMVERLERTTVSRDYVAGILDTMGDMLMVVDGQGRIHTVNPALLTALDYREEDLLGQPLDKVLADPDGRVLADLWRSSPERMMEQTYFTRTGVEVPVAFSHALMDDPRGGGRVLVCVARDITAERRAAAALQQARDQALEASQAKSRFLANISHEIRTPLNGVLGMTELLLKGENDEQRRRLATVAHRSGRMLLELINDLLDLSRIEAGRLELARVPFDLGQVMEEALDALAGQAIAQGLELLHRLPPGVPAALLGDPGRLRQILVNLLGNAIKFTERGEVILSAALLEEAKETVMLQLTVEDSGIGIPLDKQQAIFEPFTQVDSSTTRRYGGSGLGLSIVRQLATLMGGEAGVESRPGQGARFWIRLSLERDPQGPPPACWSELVGVRALLVSSNATLRCHFSQWLTQDWGLEVQTAGPADWREAELERWSVVIVDLPVGRQPPPELVSGPAPLVVMMPMEGDREIPESGPALLTKPVHRHSLYRALLGACRQAGPPPRTNTLPSRTVAPEPVTLRPLVLIADDDPGARMVNRAALEQGGFRVLEAEDGMAAVEVARLLPPGAVLLDARMPRMDGFQAAAILRQLPNLERVPIVMLTALEEAGTLTRVYRAGVSDFMAKPVDWQGLVGRLDCLLRLQAPLAALRCIEIREGDPVGSGPDLLLHLGSRGERLEVCGGEADIRASGLDDTLPGELQEALKALGSREAGETFAYRGPDGRTWQGRLVAFRGGAMGVVRTLEVCPDRA